MKRYRSYVLLLALNATLGLCVMLDCGTWKKSAARRWRVIQIERIGCSLKPNLNQTGLNY